MIFSHCVSEACHLKIHSGSHIINTLQYFYRQCQNNQQALTDFCQQKHDSLHKNFLAIYKQRHFGSPCLWLAVATDTLHHKTKQIENTDLLETVNILQ